MTMADSHDNSVREKAGIKEEKEMKKITMNIAGVALASVFAAMTAAQAADVSTGWKNDVDGNWSVAGNWTGSSGAPTGTTGVATFNPVINANRTVTLDASPWTVRSVVFTNNSADNAYGWTLTGGTLNLAGTGPNLTVNGVASRATVSSALSGSDFSKIGLGTLVLDGTSSVGVKDVNGSLVLSNGGALTNNSDFSFGSAAGVRSNSSVRVTGEGSIWNLGGANLFFSYSAANGFGASNRVTIANGGVLTNGYIAFGNRNTANATTNCSLAITNGGKVYAYAYINGDNGAGLYMGSGSSILVGTGTQPSLWDAQNSLISFASGAGGNNTNSAMTIDANGVVSNLTKFWFAEGFGNNSIGNTLTVQNGGELRIGVSGITVALWRGSSSGGSAVSNAVLITGPGSRVTMTGGGIQLGYSSPTTGICSNNTVTVSNGGLLEVVGTSYVGANRQLTGGNRFTVADGGILQYTVAAPLIQKFNYDANSGNGMVISNGTLSFRGITSGALPNLTDNLAKSGNGIGTNNFTWLGQNKFRLDSCSATNSAAGGYVFGDNGKAYNYVGLELVNGATSLRGSGVTIGANVGSALFSNTIATVGGSFTNNGVMTIANSAVTFLGDVTLGAGCVVGLPSTNQMPVTVSGTLKVDGGTVNLPASLGTKDGFTLFTSPNVITGTVKALTLSSPTHQLVLTEGGKTLVVLPRRGTLISIF